MQTTAQVLTAQKVNINKILQVVVQVIAILQSIAPVFKFIFPKQTAKINKAIESLESLKNFLTNWMDDVIFYLNAERTIDRNDNTKGDNA